MTHKPPPTPEELILSMLRDVLARQAEQMGLTSALPGPKVDLDALRDSSGAWCEAPPRPVPLEPEVTKAVEAPAAPTDLPETPEPPEPQLPESPMGPPLVEAEVVAPPRAEAPPAEPGISIGPPTAPTATEYDQEALPLTRAELEELAEYDELAAVPVLPNGLPRALRWMVVGLVVVLALANLPLVGGRAMIRALPDPQALVIRDGMLLKGRSDAVYVVENGMRRLITSIDAFEHYGYHWPDVYTVDEGALRQIPEGRPINVLLQCGGSPDVYLLEGAEKRWVSDVKALEAAGYSLDRDLRTISCNRLRSISDGLPFP